MRKNLKLRRTLNKSMHSNEIIFDITPEEYYKINLLINKLNQKYNKRIISILENYSGFEKLKFHNYLIKEIVSEVINNFEILKKYNVCVFFTGSFARITNKINSDLDLHFSYKNKYKNKLFKYEEIIYYILFSIFDLNRGKVHNMILSKISNKNKLIQSKLDSNNLKIVFQTLTEKIEYEIEGNIKARIYLQYKNKKDLKYIFRYLKNEVKFMNQEWAHVFYVFTFETEFMKYYNKLYIYEKKKINRHDIIQRKERIVDYINNIKYMLKITDKNSMRDFKNIFQMVEFKLIYEYISYKRDLYLLNGGEWKFINFLDNMDNLKEDDIFNDIMNYFYDLCEIVEPFKTKYSIHKDYLIDKNYFESMEKNLNILNKKIGDVL